MRLIWNRGLCFWKNGCRDIGIVSVRLETAPTGNGEAALHIEKAHVIVEGFNAADTGEGITIDKILRGTHL